MLRPDALASALPADLGLPAMPLRRSADTGLQQLWVAGPPPLLLSMQHTAAITVQVRASGRNADRRPCQEHPPLCFVRQARAAMQCHRVGALVCLGVS